MIQYYSDHAKAFVSVDCIIFGFDQGKLKLLLGRRKMNPGLGEWSLYGGFVGLDENVDDAAMRVLHELTGIEKIYMRQVGAYGAVNRDPGSRVISIAYCALIETSDYDEELMNKYQQHWMALDELPPLYSDHRDMVNDALALLRHRLTSEPLCFSLLPEMFTLTQLQYVYEGIMGKETDKRNFRKRMKQSGILIPTNVIDKKSSKRGAMMYKYNKEITDFHF